MTGLFAAVATPIHDDGRVDLSALDRLVQFLVAAGVDGICISGATGEYPHWETPERKAVIARAAEILPADRALLVGIGAPSIPRVLEMGQAAMRAGSRALLLPMPGFYRYEQQDLRAYCAHISAALRTPLLLYNLPEFTNPLLPETALALLTSEEFIVGIKDSSGREPDLSVFNAARGSRDWTLLVGDDRLLLKGLQAGWNGGISGIACFCPELLVAICRSFDRGHVGQAERCQELLNELIAQTSVFPAPWGIRIGLSARGIETGPLPLPLTPDRQRQIERFKAWFRLWLEEALDEIAKIANIAKI